MSIRDDANPKFIHHLRTFGEAGTVTIKNRIMHPKSADRGVTRMFLGYSSQHPSGTYRMWNHETNGVHVTRDVTWLQRLYFPKREAGEGSSPVARIEAAEGPDIIEVITSIDGQAGDGQAGDVEEDIEDGVDIDDGVDDDAEDAPGQVVTTRSGRAVTMPRRFDDYEVSNTFQDYKIELTEAERQYCSTMDVSTTH
jgi:hypothetical protein